MREREKTAPPIRRHGHASAGQNGLRASDDSFLFLAKFVEIKREPSHPPHCPHRQGSPGNAVDGAIKLLLSIQRHPCVLLEESRVTDFTTAAFEVDQHAGLQDFAIFHDESSRDRLFLADFFQNPYGLAGGLPVALAQLRWRMPEDACRLRGNVFSQPESVGFGDRCPRGLSNELLGCQVNIFTPLCRRREYSYQ